MGNRCYSTSKVKRKRTDTETTISCVTTSTVDTQGYVETEQKEILRTEKPFNYAKKPIFRKLMERNKAKFALQYKSILSEMK